MIHEYAFDICLAGALRVKAESEEEARTLMWMLLDTASANLGAWPGGEPMLCEVSIAEGTRPSLFEVDGEQLDWGTQ